MDSTNIKATDHESYSSLSILGFLFPFIGIILGIVFITKENRLDKKLGEHLIAFSMLGFIAWSVIWLIWASHIEQQQNEELKTIQQQISQQADSGLQDYSELEKDARNTEREIDIKAIHGQVEAYYAQEGKYPTLGNINDSAWRSAHMYGLDADALVPPNSRATDLAAAASSARYGYAVTPAGCDNAVDGNCTGYTLTAELEGGGTYTKRALN